MVGLDTFTQHFKEFNDQYIVIGGAACDDLFREREITFRATKDIDLVVVVEALNDFFIEHFWKFIREGRYERNEVAEKLQFYRFINPGSGNFPVQVELFSRKPDFISQKKGMRFTPIPANEDISSLSAILMDDDYYRFTIEHSEKSGVLHRADDLALICLKAKAWLDLSKRKDRGENVDSKQIRKHKNDVFRLIAILPANRQIDLPANIRDDVALFIEYMVKNPPDTKAMFKEMGIRAIGASELLGQLIRSLKIT